MADITTSRVEDRVECAYLPKLEWSKLRVKDPLEIENLFTACSTYGFFYLNLVIPEIDEFLQNWQRLLDFIVTYFHQPLEKKILDDRKSDTYG